MMFWVRVCGNGEVEDIIWVMLIFDFIYWFKSNEKR